MIRSGNLEFTGEADDWLQPRTEPAYRIIDVWP